jgi:hypothetical protein
VEKKVASVNKDKKRPTNRDRSCNSQGCSGQENAVGSEKKRKIPVIDGWIDG